MRFTRILPSLGTFQERKLFAWLPITISTKDADGRRIATIVWLERYRTMYHYSYGTWSEMTYERKLL